MTIQYESDEIIDAKYPEKGWREVEIERLAELPDATFKSTFGEAIYAYARDELYNRGGFYSYSDRDRDAYWPTALTMGLS